MTGSPSRIPWWEAEPSRLAKDRTEIGAAFPDLVLDMSQGQGLWQGRLPMWPFERPEPDGLSDLLGGQGLLLTLQYVPAYPVVYPYLFPLEPEPLPFEWTQARWHVLGNSALCLFQTQADWDPTSSAVDLLLRAGAWRVEYALLKAGVLQDMTLVGIVNDDSLDGLIAEASRAHHGKPNDHSDDPPDDVRDGQDASS